MVTTPNPYAGLPGGRARRGVDLVPPPLAWQNDPEEHECPTT
jgi:hypothetical protein